MCKGNLSLIISTNFSKLFKNCNRFCSYQNMLSLSLIILLMLIVICQENDCSTLEGGGGGFSTPLRPSLVPLNKFLNPRKFWKDLLYLLCTFVCFELSFKASSNFPLRATIFSQTFLNIGTTLRAKIYSSLQTVLKMMLRTCKVFEYIFKHDSFFTECFLL